MGKLKNHSGTKKRIKVTGGKKIMAMSGGKSHLLEKKSKTRKKRLGKISLVSKTKVAKISRLISL